MTVNHRRPRFQWHVIIRRWISQKRYNIYRYTVTIQTAIETDMWPVELCHCQWPWVPFEGHFRYCKRFYCLCVKIQHDVRNQLERSDVCIIMWTVISTVIFDRKDCYDTEHNLLAVANFLMIMGILACKSLLSRERRRCPQASVSG